MHPWSIVTLPVRFRHGFLAKKGPEERTDDTHHSSWKELRSCTACGEPISDKFLLDVGGCSWHSACLRCCICHTPLDHQPSCFLRERQIYCKTDYTK
uniref:LIM zinc-binding domain-containing protein n=1 Tax=Anopheles funestus TaxID=62324 RepID=A0A182RLS2_ANOFN